VGGSLQYAPDRQNADVIYGRCEFILPVTYGYGENTDFYCAASRSYFHHRHKGTLRALGGLDRVVLKGPIVPSSAPVSPCSCGRSTNFFKAWC
jgi:hypothetical protein